jgi:peptidoglycan hydrolase FlgJ
MGFNIDSNYDQKSVSNTTTARDDLAAKRVAVEFEAMLLSQLTKSMNKSEEDEEGLIGGSGSDVYKQMFSEQMANAIAGSGGVGIAEMLLNQLRSRAPKEQKTGLDKVMDMAKLIKKDMAMPLSASIANPAMPALPKQPSLLPSMKLDDPSTLVRPRRVNTVPTPVQAPELKNENSSPVEMRLPVEGRISSHFGVRRDPLHGRHKHHSGIDIAAPLGTPIGAAASGRVVFAGREGGYGNTVVIEHSDGKRSRYAHTEKILVSEGDHVNIGQTIATVGSTGRSTGPHLHFEVTKNGQKINPMEVLTNGSTIARR